MEDEEEAEAAMRSSGVKAPLVDRLAMWKHIPAVMDVAVLVKTVFASVAVLLLVDDRHLIACSASGPLSEAFARHTCAPTRGMKRQHTGLTVLVFFNIAAFTTLLVLKNAREWRALAWLRRHSLAVAFFFSCAAFFVAMVKVSLVTDISDASVSFRCPPVAGTANGTGPQYEPDACVSATYSLDPKTLFPSVCNDSESAGTKICPTSLECEDRCLAHVPVEVTLLMINFILAFFYMLYLAYEWHVGGLASSSILISSNDRRLFRHWRMRREEIKNNVHPAAREVGEEEGEEEEERDGNAAGAGAVRRRAVPDVAAATAATAAAEAVAEGDEPTEDRLVETIVGSVDRMQVRARRHAAVERRTVWFRVLRDLAAFFKFLLTSGALVLLVLDKEHVISCEELPNPLLPGETIPPDSVMDSCEPFAFMKPYAFAVAANYGAAMIVFVAIVVVDKFGSCRRSSRAVAGTLGFMVLACAFVQLYTVLSLLSLKTVFPCDQKASVLAKQPSPLAGLNITVTESGYCTRATGTFGVEVPVGSGGTTYESAEFQCYGACSVALPSNVSALLGNGVASYVYLFCLALVYRRNQIKAGA